ncbi:hypothetical protein LT85_2518 [Collimonas arenae]|uniref:OmpR/PhoB-type domain-containing protein n=1 Tax=Collimonas arenae TaxID=279058 RepID=A0A0A1FAX8_9BURK|nr:winged helix-turn-helix domain-containing protein [Collimonas arenae]AIY41676.1 hypothetical protein LT85_2518 [Collimonas arenae]
MHTSSHEIPDIDPVSAGFTVDNNGLVFYKESPLYLPPKERSVLKLLLHAWPKVVSKNEFKQHIWAGHMSDESLARCVTQLRHALSHFGLIQIDSLYGLGYRLTILSDKVVAPKPAQQFNASYASDTPKIHPALAVACVYAQQLLENRSVAAFQQAESTIRAVLSRAPYHMAAKLILAQCLADKISCGVDADIALVEDGLKILDQVVDIAPETPGLQSQIAHLLDCKWQFGEARLMHEQALCAAPEDMLTHFHYGLHLLATNAPIEAVSAFRCAIELNPFVPNLSLMLIRAMTFAGADPADIVMQTRSTCRMYPDNQHAYLHLLCALALKDPQPEIAHAARHILLSAPSAVFWEGKISYILARCNDSAGALGVIASQAGENVSIRAMHSAALIEMGRVDEAMAVIKEAANNGCGPLPILVNSLENSLLKLHPDYPAVHAKIFAHSYAD